MRVTAKAAPPLILSSIEDSFSYLKRRIPGYYIRVSSAHLHRNLAVLGFRYSNRTSGV